MEIASVCQRWTEESCFVICAALCLSLDTMEMTDSGNGEENILFVIQWEGFRNSLLRHRMEIKSKEVQIHLSLFPSLALLPFRLKTN